MIVYDLLCQDAGHAFEGWFSSSADYDSQKSSGLLNCPTCGSANIAKALMAPNVGTKGNKTDSMGQKSTGQRSASQENIGQETASQEGARESGPVSANNSVQVPAEYQELIGKLAKAQAKVLEASEWVGTDFPEKARAIHYGETDKKAIHGTASKDDVDALADEGVEIMPLPLPILPPETKN